MNYMLLFFLFNILILRQADYYEMLKIVYSRLYYLIKINFMYVSTVLGKGLQYLKKIENYILYSKTCPWKISYEEYFYVLTRSRITRSVYVITIFFPRWPRMR